MLILWIVVYVVTTFTTSAQQAECALSACPNGWLTYEESCYLFADEIEVDWVEATHYCTTHGSRLVVIESHGEDQMVIDHANRLFKPCGPNLPHTFFWLGATDDEVEGDWVWYTNHHHLAKGYTNWNPGEPDDIYNQDCALLYGPFHFKWGSAGCSTHGHPICEKNVTDEVPDIIG